jgi:CRISPR/Cas system-associated exonuclease Cas4 (RecB family)
MMKDFLYYVAKDIIQKYGTDLSRTVVVSPNKRASLFLNEHLARLAQKPIWSPEYITISELFRRQSTLTVADPIKLICDLHKSFCQATGSTETLDKFYGWGQLLLTDFDDIDKNMADADRVFANLCDIHELDDLSYLTDEQRELLRRFFTNFTEEHETELKQRFLRLWSHFADIYHDFNDRLTAQGLAYEGALYRQVVTATVSDGSPSGLPSFPADRYLFVGFNLLQKVEQHLFSALHKEGKAHFYWDFDHYYMQHHEAGRYIVQYLKYFPNELDTTDDDIYRNFSCSKDISFISAKTEHIQARYVPTWLREHQRYQDGRKTAIVLCDESLLPTVIHCLPDEVDKVNITTGYPLSQTPVAAFIKSYFDMYLGGHTPRLVRAFNRHPYARYVDINTEEEAPRAITTLLTMLRQIAVAATTATVPDGSPSEASPSPSSPSGSSPSGPTSDPLFQESLFRAYTLVNRLNGLIESGDLDVGEITLQRLIQQVIQQTTIPFHGEPAEGLQVMGVLETRNLDFDHVLLLSCNEGNMPRGVNDSSFIPHSIRQAYELTTVENKVSIYAYYFHRLLQRAKDVTILYNNATDDGQQGEMSRFMLQMLVESGHRICQQALQTGKAMMRFTPTAIEKTPHVMHLLGDLFSEKVLTPTAVNRYMRCPLQFYYRYVADLQEPNQPDDEQELDNRVFGNIFHNAADIIYHQLPRYITKDIIDQLLKTKVTIERAVDEAFHQELPHAPVSGLHLINREVIIRYLRQLLETDRRLAPFTIIDLECDVVRELTIGQGPLAEGLHPVISSLKIGGRVDRLDQMNDGTIRVIDYKTGSHQLKALPDVEAIFDPAQLRNHSDYYLQTFVYADIVSQKQTAKGQEPRAKVSPALLFIQHAGAEGYDPTLKLGRDAVNDIADYSDRFNELLEAKITEIFSPETAFVPTTDLHICRNCPYAPFCR